MTRKIKIVSVDPKWFQSASFRADSNVLDILAPTSWNVNMASGTVVDDNYLGNPIISQRPFQSRRYSFNWIGSHQEINTIRQIITQTSNRYFLFSGLTDHPIVTPTLMYDSRAMLASVADNYRLPGEDYQPFLTVNNSNTWNPGSYGTKVSDYAYIDYSQGASAYMYIPDSKTLDISLAPVGISAATNQVLNNIDFEITVKTLGTATNTKYKTNLSTLDGRFTQAVTNALVKIDMWHPTQVVTGGLMTDALNYVPPKISVNGEVPFEFGMPDIPSLLSPVDDYTYNIISPTLAEFSLNFQEVTNAVN